MNDSNNNIIAYYNDDFDKFLHYNLGNIPIIVDIKGLNIHLHKQKHFDCLKYINNLEEIILNPDYIGTNPNEKNVSFELIKKYSNNIQIGIKLDIKNDYLYISTMHTVQESKIQRRLQSGRIKKFNSY